MRPCNRGERSHPVGAGPAPLDNEARFFTKSGLLTARERKGGSSSISGRTGEAGCFVLSTWKKFGCSRISCGKKPDGLPGGGCGTRPLCAVLKPDMSLLSGLECRGVIVTSRSATKEFDFVSHFSLRGTGIRKTRLPVRRIAASAPTGERDWENNVHDACQASARVE